MLDSALGMRVWIGYCWLGCLSLAAACGGNSLGSGLDSPPEATGGAPGPPGAAGEGAVDPVASGGVPGGGASGAPATPSAGGSAGARAGSPSAGGSPVGAPVMGGAATGPPSLAGFGGATPISGGSPAAAGFGALGGTAETRYVPLPLPEPTPLEDCTYAVDCMDVGCNCAYQCPAYTSAASCFVDFERENDGTWACNLSTWGRAEVYRVGGVGMAEACRVVADLSAAKLEPVSDESCTPELRESSASGCQYTDVCARPVMLDNGSSATLGRFRYIGCGDTSGICLLDDRIYHADEVEPAERCDALIPYAEQPPEPVFAEPRECETTILEEIAGACQTETLCSRFAEVGPSVLVEEQEIVHAACEGDGRGGSRCACSDDEQALRFDTPWPTSDATACEVARSACEGGLEFTGPVECRQRYIAVDTVYCDSMTDCSRPASLGGSDVVAIGSVQTSCEGNGDVYDCRCVNANNGKKVEIEAPSSFEACVRAGEACRDELELRFVGQDGIISVPSP